MPNPFSERLLLHVIREIKNGSTKSKEELINDILQKCFYTDSNANNQCEDQGRNQNADEAQFKKQFNEQARDQIDGHIDDQIEIAKNYLNFLFEETDVADVKPPLVKFLKPCTDCDSPSDCERACPTNAIKINDEGIRIINEDYCIECGYCVHACIGGVLAERSDIAKVAQLLFNASTGESIYAILAPSFVGQFGPGITPEQIVGALKILGFSDVYEVAMAADIITTLEAKEFVERYHSQDPFMITSCCCPAFMRLIEKTLPSLTAVVSNSVSPMIALGRLLKRSEPDCRVVFIGPCTAKKGESKLPDMKGAIDCVLTYKEMSLIFEVSDIGNLNTMPEISLSNASHDGRIFAHTGGVTQAIKRAVQGIDPECKIVAVRGNGIKECNELLKQRLAGMLKANFMEGMACINGCVGGPGTLIDSSLGANYVNKHAKQADYLETLENLPALDFFRRTASTEELLSSKRRLSAK